jgi:uncharacterized protein (DUF1499 family)
LNWPGRRPVALFTLLFIAAALAAGSVATLAVLRLLSRRPKNLGVTDGRLAPCPATPNCVCSFDGPPRGIAPFAYEGSPEEAMARLREMLARWPLARVVRATDDYLHVECRSLLFRFVDDVEFLLDRSARVIHVRSESRAGRWDLGANRRRVEGMRRAFAPR